MKKVIIILSILIYNTIHAQVSSSLTIWNTRFLNDLPNFSTREIRADFKERSTIGVPGEGTYSTNLTISPWINNDNSGDRNHQLNFNDGGLFYRSASPLDVRWDSWRQIVITNEKGNVGIGTKATSVAKLSIQTGPDGYATTLKAISILGPNTPANPDSAQDLSWDFAAAGSAIIRGYRGNSWDTYLQFLTNSHSGIGNSPQIRIHIGSEGNVGIGSSNPDSKLTVKGKIHAEEVKVDLAVPADYVFEKYYLGKSAIKPDYTLLTLSEVEKYTEANHHLPNVPSSKEIKENGLLLGEMSNVLLQKIEELTLYMIEQKKTINKQATAIERLEKENESFKTLSERLSKIESQLKTIK
jgi:hypothetical protein